MVSLKVAKPTEVALVLVLTICIAYSDFRDRGFAALRRGEEGNIKPDRGIRAKSQRLRVRILQQGRPITMEDEVGVTEIHDMPIEKSILQARNSIFDEELHHELHREARNLANQRVRCVGAAIILPYEGDKQLEIDLVPVNISDIKILQADQCIAAPETSQEDKIILKSISISLRILLSHAHHQNLNRRSQPPLPMRETLPARPMYAILKPILEIIRHRSDVQAVRTFLENLCKTMSAAGLSFTIGDMKMSPNLITLPSLATSAATSATEALINVLTAPLRSSLKMRFPSDLTSLETQIYTNFLPQTMGTNYQVTMLGYPRTSMLANLPERVACLTSSAFEDHILDMLLLDLVSLIPARFGGEWTITSPHDGHLLYRNKESRACQAFTIKTWKERLSLQWRKMGDSTEILHTFEWGDGAEVDHGEKGILGVIKEILEGSESGRA